MSDEDVDLKWLFDRYYDDLQYLDTEIGKLEYERDKVLEELETVITRFKIQQQEKQESW
jgi:hypothetical protein